MHLSPYYDEIILYADADIDRHKQYRLLRRSDTTRLARRYQTAEDPSHKEGQLGKTPDAGRHCQRLALGISSTTKLE